MRTTDLQSFVWSLYSNHRAGHWDWNSKQDKVAPSRNLQSGGQRGGIPQGLVPWEHKKESLAQNDGQERF